MTNETTSKIQLRETFYKLLVFVETNEGYNLVKSNEVNKFKQNVKSKRTNENKLVLFNVLSTFFFGFSFDVVITAQRKKELNLKIFMNSEGKSIAKKIVLYLFLSFLK